MKQQRAFQASSRYHNHLVQCHLLWSGSGCRHVVDQQNGAASPTTGADWMLYSFAVCAIGGISLNGGNFTAVGFFCGACILTMVRNGLTMLSVDIYYEKAFLGAIILIAVAIESLRSRVAKRMIS